MRGGALKMYTQGLRRGAARTGATSGRDSARSGTLRARVCSGGPEGPARISRLRRASRPCLRRLRPIECDAPPPRSSNLRHFEGPGMKREKHPVIPPAGAPTGSEFTHRKAITRDRIVRAAMLFSRPKASSTQASRRSHAGPGSREPRFSGTSAIRRHFSARHAANSWCLSGTCSPRAWTT